MTPNFCDQLKGATAPVHRRIESSALFQRAFRQDCSLAAYVEMLRASLTAHQTVGDWRRLISTHDYQPFDRCRRIEHDLRSLGQAPPVRSQATLASAAEAWGVAYVVEGSTLGGEVLAGLFAKRLCLTERSVTYFRGYGSENRAHWAQFKQRINAWALKHPNARPAAEASAIQAFEIFLSCFETIESAVSLPHEKGGNHALVHYPHLAFSVGNSRSENGR